MRSIVATPVTRVLFPNTESDFATPTWMLDSIAEPVTMVVRHGRYVGRSARFVMGQTVDKFVTRHGCRPLRNASRPKSWARTLRFSAAAAMLSTAVLASHAHAGTDSPPGSEAEKRRKLLERVGLKKQPSQAETDRKPPPAKDPEKPQSGDDSDGTPGQSDADADAVGPARSGGDEPKRELDKQSRAPRRLGFDGALHRSLLRDCRACHAPGQLAAASRLVLTGEVAADYRQTRALVERNNPGASPLLREAAGIDHAGGRVWPEGSAAHRRVMAWITDGALRGESGRATTGPGSATSPSGPSKSDTKPSLATGSAPAQKTDAAKSDRRRAATPRSSSKASTQARLPQVDAGVLGTRPTSEASVPGFETTIHATLQRKCGACHARESAPGNFRLVGPSEAAYQNTLAFVDFSQPKSSPLLTEALGQSHAGGAVLGLQDPEYRQLLEWIGAGAPQRSPSIATTEAGVQPRAESADAGSAAAASQSTTPDAVTGASANAAGPSWLAKALSLPWGFALHGKLDLAYERGGYRGHPFRQGGSHALRSNHHHVFLSRVGSGRDGDVFELDVELLQREFYEFGVRLGPNPKGHMLRIEAGKLVVPFGREPGYHHSYGGRAGFDQEILPIIWSAHGLAVHGSLMLGPVTLSDSLYLVHGFGLRSGDAVLNMQSDLSTLDEFRVAIGNRLGLSWGPLRLWYSSHLNPLGFDRLLYMQALDAQVFRPSQWPVLRDLVFAFGLLRADVSGSDSFGGPGRDYYHFGSYWLVRYYPINQIHIEYRNGIRTHDNRRGAFFDDRRVDARDNATHSISIVGRYRGFTTGLQLQWRLERADEQPDDFLRWTLGYEF